MDQYHILPCFRNPFGYQPWREKRTFQAMFDILEADIVVMQETKIQRKDLTDDMVLVPGWDVYFSLPKHKKGYSGVAIYTRNATCAPIKAEEGILGVLCPPKSSTQFRNLPKDQQIGGYPRPEQLPGNIDELLLDSEGRCVILEFPAFVLLGVYSPANRDESRVDFRMEYLQALDARVRNLISEGKQVVLMGDLNVSRSESDSTNVAETLRKEGLSIEEWMNVPSRRLFNHLIYGGTVQGDRDEGREQPALWDLCREFHPTREGMNTCWDTKRNTRPANNGSRIDYVLCSNGLKDWFTEADIQEGLMGSDHCPVYATIADVVTTDTEQVPLLAVMNPTSMVTRDGQRLREWHMKDVLPLSAKLIPEFDRRQSIRDMFTKSADQASELSNRAEYRLGMSDASDSSKLKPLTESRSEAPPRAKRAAGFVDPLSDGGSLKRSKKSNGAMSVNPSLMAEKNARSTTTVSTKGQKTLQGFFKPVSSLAANRNNDGADWSGKSPGSESQAKQNPRPISLQTETNQIFDPVQAKESWSKLLGRRVLPRCEHNEPCISLVTKKPGVNCGASFYICARPLGPSGEKEKDSEWRCGTFIWSSDWNGSQS
ncbi:DNA lyase [Trichoderma atroviride IMI 206040]|uniref:DNA-(apurinic or apyrimidinic site) endonuclease 2 n=1 Tax=Hypocrea atroviridis (strain ATCC 20476 / IMI 206040) TaxID=452589 RepID=G9P3J6_HYPAI|nr:DNA lyase [Trichoderma atroviride IMI 206040]EHK42954.1 DNA lyase [Trichoderma atroviride IMI 206040]